MIFNKYTIISSIFIELEIFYLISTFIFYNIYSISATQLKSSTTSISYHSTKKADFLLHSHFNFVLSFSIIRFYKYFKFCIIGLPTKGAFRFVIHHYFSTKLFYFHTNIAIERNNGAHPL